jgi:hypothetical protein
MYERRGAAIERPRSVMPALFGKLCGAQESEGNR